LTGNACRFNRSADGEITNEAENRLAQIVVVRAAR
jgi:hypothetical protein